MRRLRQFLAQIAASGAVVLLLSSCQPDHSDSGTAPQQAATEPAPGTLQLHVPSPDWRDQIIYFVMIDRFADGEPGNNDQGAGEYEPGNNAKFQGGDLAGIRQQLDYIQGLGATTVWLTPPVANQWWDGAVNYGGYHGYWAEHFKEVDAHFGTLDDYRALSDALHRRGMYLVQDIVVNHTGNFFQYKGGWSDTDPSQFFVANADTVPVSKPRQAPFDQNNPNDMAQRNAAIYHWTPAIADAKVPEQELNHQLADLDDLNTENPLVRQTLRDSYGYWIREVGVDGYRIDTAFYVPADYFRDFLHADDGNAPGILTVARQTGRDQFHLFGEGFGIDRAFDDSKARKIDGYMRDKDGTALLPGMINFPLYGTLTDVFARGRPTTELEHRINNVMSVHQSPHLMPTFIDNHDVDRFLASGDAAGLRQALLFIMTVPGIPTLYYGTEQGFRDQRATMFAGGAGSGDTNHFDTSAPLYQFLKQVIALRKANPALSRGVPTVITSNAARSGALGYWMKDQGTQLLVLFNTSDRETLVDNAKTGLAAGTRLRTLFSIDGQAAEFTVGGDRTLSLALPARAGLVLIADPKESEKAPASTASKPSLSAPAMTTPVSNTLIVQGQAQANTKLALAINGDLGRAYWLQVPADGHWRAKLDVRSLLESATPHSLVAWQPGNASTSEKIQFVVRPQWQTLATFTDPANDDRGATGDYRYPTDQTWQGIQPMDIRQVSVAAAGGSLRIELMLADMTASWNPPNGFDHMALTVFLQPPGSNVGRRDMPLQGSLLPDDMRWRYRLRLNGWTHSLFVADSDASSDSEGQIRTPGALLATDAKRRTITLLLPADAFDTVTDWHGGRLYLSTWDYDGGYKPLVDAPHRSYVSTATLPGALVMDDIPVLSLKR